LKPIHKHGKLYHTTAVHADRITGFGDWNPGFKTFEQTLVYQTEHYTHNQKAYHTLLLET